MQHGDRIAAKVGASHGDDVGFVAGHELADMVA
jgi:hypothetical protein